MARLVGSFLTVSILTVSFVAAVAFFEARRALREAMADRLQTVAFEKEGELNRWVDLQRDFIVFLADLPQLRRDTALIDTAMLDIRYGFGGGQFVGHHHFIKRRIIRAERETRDDRVARAE